MPFSCTKSYSRSVFVLVAALTAGTVGTLPGTAQKIAATSPKAKPAVAKPVKKDAEALIKAAMQEDTAKVQALLDTGRIMTGR